ncbi:uncharacterized protein LOC124265514 isoform X2 [Haliotis rubra]|uniref:uncharacterized protein LOC124265514 isoform X2 n=1 Tax=Haliotis rubra TaxID=36100 RepID=UPI001EE4FE76|nr:uncharacterized protein LOC124265514 isoform X2 [Haliotis rubra]
MGLLDVGRTSVVIIYVLLHITGSLAKECVVYADGNYISRVCDDCCRYGRNRICCSDIKQRPFNSVAVMIGCVMVLAFIGSVCTAVYIKCVLPGKLRRRAEPCPAGSTAKQPAVRLHQLSPLVSTPPAPRPAYTPSKTGAPTFSSWV